MNTRGLNDNVKQMDWGEEFAFNACKNNKISKKMPRSHILIFEEETITLDVTAAL